jgi:hypothetical protein
MCKAGMARRPDRALILVSIAAIDWGFVHVHADVRRELDVRDASIGSAHAASEERAARVLCDGAAQLE